MSKPRRVVTADKYTRVINAAMAKPWALTQEMVAVVWDLLRFRAAGGRLTPEEIRARIGPDEDDEDESPRRQMRTIRPAAGGAGAIGVVPVYGVIAHRTFEASSGMTSTEAISAMFKRAIADPEVSDIVLDISSPGGGVEGVPELAAEIAQSKGRGTKRVVAIANNLAASAAYWIASQADELVVMPSGQVGSIGVFSLHEDWSGWLEKEGIKITALSAGERKLEGNPWEPLDTEAKAHFQAQVDEVYADFVKAVARGRGVSQAKVKNDFGQGRVFGADEALRRGMVDAVETFDQLVSRLATRKSRGSAAAAMGEPFVSVAAVRARDGADPDPAPVPPAAPADDAVDLQLVADGMKMALELDES